MTGPKKPFSPRPARPKLRVRLEDDGPFVDLGISYSELIVGLLDTVEIICIHTGAGMDDNIRVAIENLATHRPDRKGKGTKP